MPAVINLKRMSVAGWKAIREPLEIPFNGESWLIHGENEVGKSSIFSALRLALFENPDANGAWAAGWVNNQSPEARVEVELLIDGDPFTIIKTRSATGNGSTNLFEGIGAHRVPLSTGRDAVEEILELVGASARSGRADEIPSDWGILAWLLAPQGMDSVSPARQHGTQTLGLESAISPEMVQVEESLRNSLGNELTPTGKPIKNGTYRAAIGKVTRADHRIEEIETDRASYTEILQEVMRKEAEIEATQDKLAEAAEEVQSLRGTVIDLTQREGEIKTIEAQRNAKQAEVDAASTAIDTLKTIEDELAGHKKDVHDAVGKIKLESEKKNDVDVNFTKNTELLKSTRESHQDSVDSIDAKNSLIIAATKIQQRDELQGKIDSLDEIDKEVAELEAQGPVIDDEALDGMNDLAVRLERAEGMLSSLSESRGISAEVEGQLEASWEVDGQETEVESKTRFAQQLKIDGEGFSINLNRDLADDDANWAQRRVECVSELSAHGVSSSEELRDKEVTERKRAESMRDLSTKKSVLGDRDIIADQLEKLSDVQDPSEDTPDIDALNAEVRVLGSMRDDQKEQIKGLDETVEDLRAQRQTLGERLGDLRAEEQAAKELEENCGTRRDEEIGTGGTIQTRKDSHSKLISELTGLTKEFNDSVGLMETEEQAQQDGLTRALRVKAQFENESRHLGAESIALEQQAQDLGGANLHRDFIDAREALNEAESTKDRIERRVRAEERLLERFKRALTASTIDEIGPIMKRVEQWLSKATLGRWTSLEMDSTLNVTALHGPNQIRSIEGEGFGSMGLQQLIHALIRLSVACKIHDDKAKDDPEFPPVALVMDESQSHIDDRRVVRLMDSFNREIASGRVQVIALSHRMSEFQSLEAINYNVDRREVTDQRNTRA